MADTSATSTMHNALLACTMHYTLKYSAGVEEAVRLVRMGMCGYIGLASDVAAWLYM